MTERWRYHPRDKIKSISQKYFTVNRLMPYNGRWRNEFFPGYTREAPDTYRVSREYLWSDDADMKKIDRRLIELKELESKANESTVGKAELLNLVNMQSQRLVYLKDELDIVVNRRMEKCIMPECMWVELKADTLRYHNLLKCVLSEEYKNQLLLSDFKCPSLINQGINNIPKLFQVVIERRCRVLTSSFEDDDFKDLYDLCNVLLDEVVKDPRTADTINTATKIGQIDELRNELENVVKEVPKKDDVAQENTGTRKDSNRLSIDPEQCEPEGDTPTKGDKCMKRTRSTTREAMKKPIKSESESIDRRSSLRNSSDKVDIPKESNIIDKSTPKSQVTKVSVTEPIKRVNMKKAGARISSSEDDERIKGDICMMTTRSTTRGAMKKPTKSEIECNERRSSLRNSSDNSNIPKVPKIADKSTTKPQATVTESTKRMHIKKASAIISSSEDDEPLKKKIMDVRGTRRVSNELKNTVKEAPKKDKVEQEKRGTREDSNRLSIDPEQWEPDGDTGTITQAINNDEGKRKSIPIDNDSRTETSHDDTVAEKMSEVSKNGRKTKMVRGKTKKSTAVCKSANKKVDEIVTDPSIDITSTVRNDQESMSVTDDKKCEGKKKKKKITVVDDHRRDRNDRLWTKPMDYWKRQDIIYKKQVEDYRAADEEWRIVPGSYVFYNNRSEYEVGKDRSNRLVMIELGLTDGSESEESEDDTEEESIEEEIQPKKSVKTRSTTREAMKKPIKSEIKNTDRRSTLRNSSDNSNIPKAPIIVDKSATKIKKARATISSSEEDEPLKKKSMDVMKTRGMKKASANISSSEDDEPLKKKSMDVMKTRGSTIKKQSNVSLRENIRKKASATISSSEDDEVYEPLKKKSMDVRKTRGDELEKKGVVKKNDLKRRSGDFDEDCGMVNDSCQKKVKEDKIEKKEAVKKNDLKRSADFDEDCSMVNDSNQKKVEEKGSTSIDKGIMKKIPVGRPKKEINEGERRVRFKEPQPQTSSRTGSQKPSLTSTRKKNTPPTSSLFNPLTVFENTHTYRDSFLDSLWVLGSGTPVAAAAHSRNAQPVSKIKSTVSKPIKRDQPSTSSEASARSVLNFPELSTSEESDTDLIVVD